MDERAPDRTAGTKHAPPPETLTAQAAAARIGVNERTIRRAIARGDLPATKISGSFRIAVTDLDYYQQAGGRPVTRGAAPVPLHGQHFPATEDTPRSTPQPLRLLSLPDWPPGRGADLPRPATSLVGREREAAEVHALLRLDEVRLVTLTGPGGVGKTRLAIQIAAEAADDFADGVAFVPLASVSGPDLVAPTIFRALGGRESGSNFAADRLHLLLGDRAVFLVLDNFEHLVPAATTVADLLNICPRLKILVTSRAALRLSGEHEYLVPPLSLPGAVARPSPEEVLQAEAVRLFVQRAKAFQPGFAVTADNAAAVGTICQCLDGLPLAIELAAARTNHLSPGALLDRLDRPSAARLALLTGGPRDFPARLQAMRNAIAWSYDLLDAAEQALFQRLAVFIGGFSLAAAAAVCQSDELAVLDGISSLVAKSLVRYVGDQAGEPRYGMLETIREFGLEQLAASGDEQAVRQLHAEWCLAVAEEAGPRAKQPQAAPWLAALEREHPNLRAALTWLAGQGEGPRLLRMAASLWPFWQEHTYFGEGLQWLELALDLGRDAPAAVRLRALNGAGVLAWYLTDVERAQVWDEAALELAREVGDRTIEAFSLSNLGVQAIELGDYERALASFEAGLAVAHEIESSEAEVLALHNLACLALVSGDPATSARRGEEALALARKDGWDWIVPTILVWYGFTTADLGDIERATALFHEGLELGDIRGNLGDVIDALGGLARIGVATGRMREAARLLGAVATLREEIGQPQPQVERTYFEPFLTELRDILGAEQFAAAWADGQSLSRQEAMAAALAIRAEPAPAAPPASGDEFAGPATLTRRQLEILRLLAAGLSNREIGERLFISPATAARHIANLYAKIEVDSRAKAVAFAHRYGLD